MTNWRWLRQHVGGKPWEAAEMVLATFIRDAPATASAPVDVHAIVRWLGVDLRSVDGWDAFAMTQSANIDFSIEDDRAEIRVRATDHPNHQRFSLAHEIGHLMLHPPGQYDRVAMGAPNLVDAEREANQFGAALLMPKAWVAADGYFETVNASVLARKYKVSDIAMTYRLKNLGLLP